MTASGPEIPAAAREQTEAGAEAFVRFFFDQLNTALTEPRAGLIKSLSDPKCEFCKGTEDTAVYLVRENERYATNPVDVIDVEAFVGAPEGQQYLALSMVQKRADIVDAKGVVVATDSRKDADSNVGVVWSSGRWLMLAVERTE